MEDIGTYNSPSTTEIELGDFVTRTRFRGRLDSDETYGSFEILGDESEISIPVLKGDQGPKGDDGRSIEVLGIVDDVEDLPEEHEEGDTWLVRSESQVYQFINGSWEAIHMLDVDSLQKGDKGDRGDDGESAYEIAVRGGYSGTEQQWLTSLRGATGARGPAGRDSNPNARIVHIFRFNSRGHSGTYTVNIPSGRLKTGQAYRVSGQFTGAGGGNQPMGSGFSLSVNINNNFQVLCRATTFVSGIVGTNAQYGMTQDSQYQICTLPSQRITQLRTTRDFGTHDANRHMTFMVYIEEIDTWTHDTLGRT